MRSGLSELEIWGFGPVPISPPPPPAGNLAANPTGEGFPKASCSWISRFDKSVGMVNDGLINFRPAPMNRWTSYESPNDSDWLEIDFGKEQRVGVVKLYIYDDRGGVQAPASYDLQYWTGTAWESVPDQRKEPSRPAGGQINTVTFPQLATTKLRVSFVHQGKARSGLTEIEVWEK
jgi:hypothetical protein